MGHSPPTTLATYTHVIRELKNCRRSPLLSKSTKPARLVDAWWTSKPQAERHKPAKRCRSAAMARPGLEPGTPRFSVCDDEDFDWRDLQGLSWPRLGALAGASQGFPVGSGPGVRFGAKTWARF
jgi:hypothetical protein